MMSGARNTAAAELRDERVQRRCAQVADAAVKLFARQGYYKTTIQEIATDAGVSVGLIYKYFTDKDDILMYVLLQVIDGYRTRIPRELVGVTDELERFEIAVDAYCRVIDSMRAETVLAYRSTKSLPAGMREVVKQSELETNEIIADCIRGCVDKGIFRGVNADLAAYQVVMFAHAWALKYWRLSRLTTLDAYIADGTKRFLFGFSAQSKTEAVEGS